LPLRRVVGFLAITAVVAGLAIAAYSFLQLRIPVPEQVEAVENPVSCSAPTTQETATATPSQEPEPSRESDTPLYSERPQLGDRIGTITLPSLGLSWPIYEGTEEEQLSKGVGHYVDSVLPGMADNSILSGHRTSVFNRIGELEVNDLILVQTSAGIFNYQVRAFRIVDRSDTTVIQPAPKAVLTLTTCYPFDSLVRTTQAFLVEADLVDSLYKE
jgi:sortase A